MKTSKQPTIQAHFWHDFRQEAGIVSLSCSRSGHITNAENRRLSIMLIMSLKTQETADLDTPKITKKLYADIALETRAYKERICWHDDRTVLFHETPAISLSTAMNNAHMLESVSDLWFWLRFPRMYLDKMRNTSILVAVVWSFPLKGSDTWL